jgi:ABC-type antimicrobial peptide transport system permease subunit
MHPLVASHFRYNRLQVAVNVVGISFEVMALLMLAGLSRNLEARPYAVQMIGWVTVYFILWFVLAVSAGFVLVSRYSQIRERAQEFAILKMLGASTGYISDLLCEETAVVVIPGTVLGILWAYAGRSLIGVALPHSFLVRGAYEWWPLACLISAVGSLLAGMLAVRVTVGDDFAQALMGED